MVKKYGKRNPYILIELYSNSNECHTLSQRESITYSKGRRGHFFVKLFSSHDLLVYPSIHLIIHPWIASYREKFMTLLWLYLWVRWYMIPYYLGSFNTSYNIIFKKKKKTENWKPIFFEIIKFCERKNIESFKIFYLSKWKLDFKTFVCGVAKVLQYLLLGNQSSIKTCTIGNHLKRK
jgi:hypothetical protein